MLVPPPKLENESLEAYLARLGTIAVTSGRDGAPPKLMVLVDIVAVAKLFAGTSVVDVVKVAMRLTA